MSNEDGRGGMRLGADVENAYAGEVGYDDKAEYVTELAEEEQEREDEEEHDEGRLQASHPSTLQRRMVSRNNFLSLSQKRLDLILGYCFVDGVYYLLKRKDSRFSFAAANLQAEKKRDGDDDDAKLLEGRGSVVNTRIADRESDYQRRRQDRVVREDGLSFAESMKLAAAEKEKDELIRQLRQQQQDNQESSGDAQEDDSSSSRRKKRRWDTAEESSGPSTTPAGPTSVDIVTDTDSVASKKSKWELRRMSALFAGLRIALE